ncbi:hypothetical protein NMY22_g3263 [Coprinellus aureogranulatus]|nr:hypothetical protein NMY22_g3263 [Coprinellus aureogranulatus]
MSMEMNLPKELADEELPLAFVPGDTDDQPSTEHIPDIPRGMITLMAQKWEWPVPSYSASCPIWSRFEPIPRYNPERIVKKTLIVRHLLVCQQGDQRIFRDITLDAPGDNISSTHEECLPLLDEFQAQVLSGKLPRIYEVIRNYALQRVSMKDSDPEEFVELYTSDYKDTIEKGGLTFHLILGSKIAASILDLSPCELRIVLKPLPEVPQLGSSPEGGLKVALTNFPLKYSYLFGGEDDLRTNVLWKRDKFVHEHCFTISFGKDEQGHDSTPQLCWMFPEVNIGYERFGSYACIPEVTNVVDILRSGSWLVMDLPRLPLCPILNVDESWAPVEGATNSKPHP